MKEQAMKPIATSVRISRRAMLSALAALGNAPCRFPLSKVEIEYAFGAAGSRLMTAGPQVRHAASYFPAQK
jgi:hypothetical protein